MSWRVRWFLGSTQLLSSYLPAAWFGYPVAPSSAFDPHHSLSSRTDQEWRIQHAPRGALSNWLFSQVVSSLDRLSVWPPQGRNRSLSTGVLQEYLVSKYTIQMGFFGRGKKKVQMDVLSIVQLTDVNGKPSVKISGLPCPLRVGDPLTLKFRIERTSHGRLEVLEVDGKFRITSVGFEAMNVLPRKQLLSVEAIERPPTWASTKKPSEKRPLAPAKSPPFSL